MWYLTTGGIFFGICIFLFVLLGVIELIYYIYYFIDDRDYYESLLYSKICDYFDDEWIFQYLIISGLTAIYWPITLLAVFIFLMSHLLRYLVRKYKEEKEKNNE